MKKLVTIFASIVLLVLAGCSQKEESPAIAVTGVKVTPANLTLVIGETSKLDATVEPADATDKTVLWSSSNAAVAMVGSDGLVAALKEGTATITASAGGKSTTCNVTVVTTYVEATGLTLDKTALELTEGDTYTLSATIAPADASNKYPEWTSSDSDVAVVDGNGKVVALKAGSATITATVDKQKASCQVTVAQKILAVSRVVLDKEALDLIEGDTFTLTATVEPDYATDQTVTWSTSDASVATVADGLVTAIAEGTATISATAGDFTATCEVAVFPEYAYVDLGVSVLWATCNIGATVPEEAGDLYAWGEIEPKESYEWSNYKWGTSNNLTKYNISNKYGSVVDHKVVLEPEDDAATVNLNPMWHTPTRAEWGELLSRCTWTRTSENGVNVYRISSNTNDNSIILPRTSGTYWSSSLVANDPYFEPTKAWVLQDFYYMHRLERYRGFPIRPVRSRGYVAVESISLDKESIETFVGRTLTLTTTIEPYYATNSTISWESSQPSVASVSEGVVTALSAGEATITASADGKQVTCRITVLKPNEPEAVDLGLSVKWASFNVGAYLPEEAGDLFAWGETSPKEKYEWSNYKWGTSNNLTKYNISNSNGSNPDNKVTLEAEDDAATANWGSKWRTPTGDEWNELLSKCTWIRTTQNGIEVYRIASNTNDNSIILPRNYWLWSSSLYEVYPYQAWHLYTGSQYMSATDRSRGVCIRPVCQ